MEKNSVRKWYRVTKGNPCGSCGKTSWCTFSPELKLILCMRLESKRPSKNSMGGWLFPLRKWDGELPADPIARPTNLIELWKKWKEETTQAHKGDLADDLGVTPETIDELWIVYSLKHKAYAIPMCDGEKNVIGIRMRAMDGKKWAVSGSKNGLFIPNIPPKKEAMIVEGATDTLAALTMGYFAIGLPAAGVGGEYLKRWCTLNPQTSMIIFVPDNDKVGVVGMTKVKENIKRKSVTWLPPCNDLREYLNMGGTKEMISSMTKDMVWTA